MTIGEYIGLTDPEQYYKLIKMYKVDKSKKKIKLGDSIESLMRHDSYKRVKGRIRQIKWG